VTPSFRVSGQEAGERLDVVLARRAGLARSRVQRLLAAGLVRIDGQVRPKHFELHAGEHVTWQRPPPAAAAVNPEPLEVPVLYEDRWLLVVDKPAGMVVHPAPGHEHGTLVNALATRGLAGGHDLRPGVVHRLDKDTSGLMVVAREEAAYHSLTTAMAARAVTRTYVALLVGSLPQDEGTVDAPIGRHVRDRKRMSVHTVSPRRAVTHFAVTARYPGYTLARVRLETGRTHQIRVHFAALGYPVAGDLVYGRRPRPAGLSRQFLHAAGLSLDHPIEAGRHLRFEAPLPPELARFLASLGPAEA
jgi:23S rRNA pseudouridine1911/1915/1917 synthase